MKSTIRILKSHTAFTLIELLVVVTIIVVLLALLTPALDKAIYQAELAVCASNQRTTASGAVMYATGNKRSYPYREGVRDDIGWPMPGCIYNGNLPFQAAANGGQSANTTVYDDRPALRTFLSLNDHLNDPLTSALDFDRVDGDTTAFASYNLWFGFNYKGHRGMKRIGDRITWKDTPNWDANRIDRLWEFDVLVSDHESNNFNLGGGNTRSSHPDNDAILTGTKVQNGEWGGFGPALKFTLSFWESGFKRGRGPLDLNFGYQDGSVFRQNQVGFDGVGQDADMAYVPVTNIGTQWQVTMPVRR